MYIIITILLVFLLVIQVKQSESINFLILNMTLYITILLGTSLFALHYTPLPAVHFISILNLIFIEMATIMAASTEQCVALYSIGG